MDSRQNRGYSPGSHAPSTAASRPVRTFHRWSSGPDSKTVSPTTDQSGASASRTDNGFLSSPTSLFAREASPTSPASAGRESISFPFSDNRPVDTRISPVDDRSPWRTDKTNDSPSPSTHYGSRQSFIPAPVNPPSKPSRISPPTQEIPHAKPAKRSTLHLLNPVNLLMRRRSGLTQEMLNESTNSKGLTVPRMTLPQDYDPRIRGNVVHDFSAPRPRRVVSQQEVPGLRDYNAAQPNDQGVAKTTDHIPASDNRRVNQHTAVFREHLQDETDPSFHSSAVRTESLANLEFLKRVSQNYPTHGRNDKPTVLPPSPQTDFQQFRKSIGDWQARISNSSPTSSSSDNSPLRETNAGQRAPNASPISAPPAPERSITFASAEDVKAAPLEVIPEVATSLDKLGEKDILQHAKSNASRFSFQLRPLDHAVEEKLLEERARRKMPAPDVEPGKTLDDDDDYFDEDAMYDADELEGLDAESGYSTPDEPFAEDSINDISDHQLTDEIQPSQVDINPGVNTNVQEYLRWQRAHRPDGVPGNVRNTEAQNPAGNDYNEKRSDSHQGLAEVLPGQTDGLTKRTFAPGKMDDDEEEDFYFDDGTFDAFGSISSTPGPDEDELFGVKDEGGLVPPAKKVADDLTLESSDNTMPDSQIATKILQAQSVLARAQDMLSSRNLLPPAPEGLEEYHNALAEAAQQAAVDGKFSRASSTRSSSSSLRSDEITQRWKPRQVGEETSLANHYLSPINESGNPLAGNDSAVASMPTTYSASEYTPGEDDVGLSDDAADDMVDYDAIISEANAEALASDFDGFYGREFGFYAKARPGSSDEACVNGGFFGTPGFSTIERHHSVKEPNLTPITEHSEFSTRNSFIGGVLTPALGTPVFAAHLTLAQLQDEDLSLDQLLRLRDRPFAPPSDHARSGSIASSLSSSGHMVPPFKLSHRRSWTAGGPPTPSFPFNNTSTAQSVLQQQQQQRPFQRSPDSAPFLGPSPMSDLSPVSPSSAARRGWADGDEEATPRKAPARGGGAGHVRSASGDSVAYLKERDEAGRERWILERRRTSHAGLTELVGREVVQGGI